MFDAIRAKLRIPSRRGGQPDRVSILLPFVIIAIGLEARYGHQVSGDHLIDSMALNPFDKEASDVGDGNHLAPTLFHCGGEEIRVYEWDSDYAWTHRKSATCDAAMSVVEGRVPISSGILVVE